MLDRGMSVLVALSDGAVLFEAQERARVRLAGPDARAFLHRMSTNHVSEVAVGQGKLNVLTTDKGRVVDLLLHLDRGEDGVLLIGSPGRGPVITAWLDRYLFSERVELSDLSGTGSACEIAGTHAPALVEALVPTSSGQPPWGFCEKDGVIVVRDFDRVDAAGERVPCFLIVTSFAAGDGVAAMLSAARASADESEAARIGAGVPALTSGERGELVEKHNPLDLGLHDAIHWNKGCYIGQEVIARLDTYQRQRKMLVALTVAPADRARLLPGAPVIVDEAVVGEITSVSPMCFAARPNALAVGKFAGSHAAQVRIGDEVIHATVDLPAVAQLPHT